MSFEGLQAIEEYLAVLRAAETAAMREVRPVFDRALFNIKRSAKSRAAGHPHLPFYAASITYDSQRSGMTLTGEVGPDKGRKQGALGNIAEFATGHHGPVLPVLGPATDEEIPRYEQALADAIERAFGE
jgi:hypothetical protein